MRFRRYPSPGRRPRLSGERLAVERLEDRTLPSTILWANRGAPGADTDGFQAVYGANAAQARTVVDAAIDDWEAVIQNFNYRNVGTRGNAPAANTFTLQISAAALGSPGLRGVTSITGIDDDDKPFQSSIQLDDNGGGAGWFIDPTPHDHAEFSNLVTRFTATSPAAATRDLYRTVLHEIGHALGIASDSRLAILDLLTDSGINDPNIAAGNPAEDLLTFAGPTVTATFTTAGGRHLYEGPVVGGLPTHPNDLLNPGRATPAGTRNLITDLDAQILADAYGYTITLPSTVETFTAYRNPTTGVLTVNGDLGVFNDTITLDKPLASWRVNVNNFVMTFAAASVMGITINAGTGNDTVNVRYTIEGVPVTVNAGSGNDTINLGTAGNSLDAILGAVTVYGGGGSDKLSGDSGNDKLCGGDGDDWMYGGTDADLLNGDKGWDNLYGEDGDDWLIGGEGDDWLDGGTGHDLLQGLAGNDRHDELFGGGGTDSLLGGRGNDRLDGGNDKKVDQLTGGTGSDTFVQHEWEDWWGFKSHLNDDITDFNADAGDVKIWQCHGC